MRWSSLNPHSMPHASGTKKFGRMPGIEPHAVLPFPFAWSAATRTVPDCGLNAALAVVVATLPQTVTVDIEPATGIANEAAALVQTGCRGATNTIARYELYFSSRGAGDTYLSEFQTQPPLLPVECNVSGTRARVPGVQKVNLVAQDEGCVS